MIACPSCGKTDSIVVQSRSAPFGIRRRRECTECGHRWPTLEVARADLLEAAVREEARTRRSAGCVSAETHRALT